LFTERVSAALASVFCGRRLINGDGVQHWSACAPAEGPHVARLIRSY
jgi:hypothetical protein